MRAYVGLTKTRIIEQLLVVTVPAMFLAERGIPPVPLILATLVGGATAAASAHALNCVIDADIDVKMKRTARRPLARGQVPPSHALVFGLVLGRAQHRLAVADHEPARRRARARRRSRSTCWSTR